MNRRKIWMSVMSLLLVLTGCGKGQESANRNSVSATESVFTEKKLPETEEATASIREFNFENIKNVTNETEALSALEDFANLKDDKITFRYGGSDTNGAETWYDFIECYNYTPIWGEIIRIHVFPNCSQIQGKLLLSGFETPEYTLSGEEALNAYTNKENVITDGYVCVEMCYLYTKGNDTIPLCYHYSDEINEIFLEAKTGDMVAQRTNLIIG